MRSPVETKYSVGYQIDFTGLKGFSTTRFDAVVWLWLSSSVHLHDMRFFLVTLFAAFLIGCAHHSTTARGKALVPSMSTNSPIETLLQIRTFAFGGVGYAGIRSPGEVAFRAIITNKNASEVFSAVLTNGTTEGKLYAFTAVRKLSQGKFEPEATHLDPNATVVTRSGCFIRQEKASEVLARIRAGSYDTFINDVLR